MAVISSVGSCPIQRIAISSPGFVAPSKRSVSDMIGPMPFAQRVSISPENQSRLETRSVVETIWSGC